MTKKKKVKISDLPKFDVVDYLKTDKDIAFKWDGKLSKLEK